MKINLILISIIGLLFYWACDPAVPTTPITEVISNNKPPKDTITIATADSLAINWRDLLHSTSFNNNKPIYGFVLPIVDLKQVIKEGADSARFYIGYTGTEYKLMVVGVDKDGKDMLDPNIPYQRVYDLSTPCPPSCGSIP